MSIQWSLVLFTALTGIAGWMFACIALAEFVGRGKKAAFGASVTAMALAVVGGICSVTHLGHVENIMNVFGHPTEGIFLEALLVGLMCLFGLIYAVMVKREASAGTRKALAALAGIVGILLSFFAGKSYMMASIPAWDTALLPIAYCGTAFAGGVAAYLAISALAHDESADLAFFGKVLLAAGIVACLCAIAYFGVAAQSQIGVGLLAAIAAGAVPAVCGWVAAKSPEKALAMAITSLACALVGIIALRAGMWLAFDRIYDLFEIAL